MATQRIRIVKVGGTAADVVIRRIREWSLARQSRAENEWSSEQWSADIRKRADELAERLRSHAFVPPIIHFVEWVDTWSGGDVFHRWLMPPGREEPLVIYADQFELFAYPVSDGGHLFGRLSGAQRQQQWTESRLLVRRLQEAIEAWQELADRAVVVVLRQVVQGTLSDEAVAACLKSVPDWLL
jgi:hypothetical protein